MNMGLFREKSPRRDKLRRDIAAGRLAKLSSLLNADAVVSVLLWLLFVVLSVLILAFKLGEENYDRQTIPIAAVVVLISLAAAFYIHLYQKRIITNHLRALTLLTLFILLLTAAKLGMLLTGQVVWVTITAVTEAVILTIAYDQRFAIGISLIYVLLACFAAGAIADINLLLTATAGAFTCCLALREIRTRMKLLEVGTTAAVVVFVTSIALAFLSGGVPVSMVFKKAGYHAGGTFLVGLLMQGLLPLIEKVFRISTSMTLLDYSDANQPLLKRLAMEAPGTFSHSLLVGSIAEAAAEAIGRNGLLCRVGAYYHDIGKINKPSYFTENEMGSDSKHKELSPAMSQLIIVGHVKDGIEMAREYGLPSVLRQFIETHHGTTLVEYFYDQAKKQQDSKQSEPSEAEFRYPGPKPRTKEAAIVMLADCIEGAVRSLPEKTPTKIEAVVHNMAMKRLQDGQFDECDLTLRELSQIEASITKTLAAHYHGRVAYPKSPDQPDRTEPEDQPAHQKTSN